MLLTLEIGRLDFLKPLLQRHFVDACVEPIVRGQIKSIGRLFSWSGRKQSPPGPFGGEVSLARAGTGQLSRWISGVWILPPRPPRMALSAMRLTYKPGNIANRRSINP